MPAANKKKQRSRHQVLIKRNMFFGWLVITHDDKSLLDIFVPVSCHLQKKQMSRHQFVIRRDMFFGRLVFTAWLIKAKEIRMKNQNKDKNIIWYSTPPSTQYVERK